MLGITNIPHLDNNNYIPAVLSSTVTRHHVLGITNIPHLDNNNYIPAVLSSTVSGHCVLDITNIPHLDNNNYIPAVLSSTVTGRCVLGITNIPYGSSFASMVTVEVNFDAGPSSPYYIKTIPHLYKFLFFENH